MGTTRIKVIDLSSEKQEIKTSGKHARLASLAKRAAKLAVPGKVKAEKKPGEEKLITEGTGKVTEDTDSSLRSESSVPSVPSVLSVIHKQSGASKTAKTNQRHIGKKYLQAKAQIDPQKDYGAKEAIELLHKTSYAKFDPTVEIHFNVSDKNIKGNVKLPHPFGKKKQKIILVFTDKKLPDDKNIIIGSVKTVDDIQSGKLRPNRDFNAVIAEPKFMTALVKIAKILGPAGLMPNPKDKTISEDPTEVLRNQSSQQDYYEYKTDPIAPVIHSTLGKLSTKPDYLEKNLKTLALAIGAAKIKKAVIKSTMSPAISLDITSLAS